MEERDIAEIEKERKNTARRRWFWTIVVIDLILLGIIIWQICSVFIDAGKTPSSSEIASLFHYFR